MRHPSYSGVVYIDEELGVVPRQFPIEGYWDLEQRVAEDGPGWLTATDAIEWGRKRAPTVSLRVHRSIHVYRYLQVDGILFRLHAPVSDEHVVYSAGEDAMLHGDDVKRWPGAPTTRDADVLPGYGGKVWLVQWPPENDGANMASLTARWETLTDGVQHVAEVAGPDWDGGIEAAVEWARQRAPYVLVCQGPRRFGYLSAGDADPPGLDLPRWRGLAEMREHFREHPPQIPQGVDRWIVTLEDDSKSFPLPEDVEPAGGLPGPSGD
jgi:hypothetical protein